MRVGYARISTLDQNLDLQIDALLGCGCEKVYQDEGFSGTKAKRPGLDDALASLSRGDVFVIWKLDRLGRSLQHLLQISQQLEKLGVDLISLSDGIDTSTPHGKLFFQIVGAFCEYESNVISERTKAGMASARARGVKLGRPRKLTDEQRVALVHFDSDALDEAASSLGADKSARKSTERSVE